VLVATRDRRKETLRFRDPMNGLILGDQLLNDQDTTYGLEEALQRTMMEIKVEATMSQKRINRNMMQFPPESEK